MDKYFIGGLGAGFAGCGAGLIAANWIIPSLVEKGYGWFEITLLVVVIPVIALMVSYYIAFGKPEVR